MSYCETKIITDIAAPCDNPFFSGYANKAYLINKSDWDLLTVVQGNNVITNIALPSGMDPCAHIVYVKAKKPFNGLNTSIVSGDVENKFTHTVPVFIQNDGAVFRDKVATRIANGRFVLIVESDWNDNNSKFQVYGSERGLVCNEGSIEAGADPDGWNFTLVEENVPSSGIYVFGGATSPALPTVETTRAMLEDLVETE